MQATVRPWLVLALALAPSTLVFATPDVAHPLLERHARWLEEVAALISDDERDAFEAIDETYRRDAFIESFWRVRDPHPESSHNELRDAWETRLDLARERYGTLADVRAQVLLLVGDPEERRRTDCPSLLRPAEIWTVQPTAALPSGASVVFAKRPDRPSLYEGWTPTPDLEGLTAEGASRKRTTEKLRAEIAKECPKGRQLLDSLALSLSVAELRRRTVPHPGTEWLVAFAERSTAVEDDARPLPAEIGLSYPGRRQGRTIVQVALTVPRESLAEAGSPEIWRFVVDGEVLRRDELLESFRYRFELPAVAADSAEPATGEPGMGEPGMGELGMVIQRHLRPGEYSLRLRLESLDTQRFFRTSRDLVVPIVGADTAGADTVGTAAAGEDPVAESFLASMASIGASSSQAHSITLSPPPPGLHTGRLRVEARTTGDGVSGVAFELNGRRLMTKRRPPWSIEVDLGQAPRIHELRAVALAADRSELVSDRIRINAGAQNFSVRLVEPRPGGSYRRALRARAVIDVPRGSRLDRLEFHVGERRVATLYQPPFVQVLPLSTVEEIEYVRAVAYLDDGLSTESLVFVNSPENLDRIDIHLVELYTTVVDRKGRPVEGLVAGDFDVRENEVSQQIRRFEHASDLPFHAAVVLDTSTSMADELRETERAALQFFENLVTPRDRAAVVTFADEPSLVVPFTNDLDVLAGGLADIEATGETTLHDSIVFTLYHFGGLSGQRALILLSDGEDSMSHYSFEETLAFARETGVAIYAIGLDIPSRAHEARSKLMRLCRETGGQHFFISRSGELERVYRRIENELRSQYLLAYQSSLEGEGYREIDVRLSQPALEAKTIAGYDP